MPKKPIKISDPEGLAKRISLLRKELGLKRPALANLLGTSAQSILRWEKGAAEPPIGALEKLANLSRKSVEWLVTGNDGAALLDCPVVRAHNPLDRRPPDPAVITILGMAWSVLESQTTTAKALTLNVREFYEKVFAQQTSGGESIGGGPSPATEGAAVGGAAARKKARPAK